MIKARGKGADGRPLLVFGLSHENLRRLRAGNPIIFDAKAYGFDGTVLIFSGKDEAAMAKEIINVDPGVAVIQETNAGPT